MMRLISKRSSSIISRRTLAALTYSSFETITATLPKHFQHYHPSTSASDLVPGNLSIPFFYKVRDFHAISGPLDFRASSPSRAEYAAIDDYEEVSTKVGNDDGLEIAKLDISPEIVSALAKRGITKLFPIQVLLSHLLSLFFLRCASFVSVCVTCGNPSPHWVTLIITMKHRFE